MAHEKREDRLALLCDDCNEEIFVDMNMLMVHDKLWLEIISKPKKRKKEDSLCACCMEKRLGRPLTREDWKKASGDYHLSHPMCNYMTEQFRTSPEGIEYEKKQMSKKTEIDYLDKKYKYIKGLPRFVYKNGYSIFVEEEYWGHVNPVEVIYTLVNENGDEIGCAHKGDIQNSLKEWGEKYGKKTLLK